MTISEQPTAAAARRQTIVRRHRTRDFAIVPNEVLNDRRLTMEQRGCLAWLLSRPGDWQVIPAQLRAQWAIEDERIGRDRVYRILDALIATRYCDRNRIHGDGGLFVGFEYVIYDEPIGRGFKDSAPDDEEKDSPDDAETPPGSTGPRGPFVSGTPTQPFTENPYTVEPDTVKPDAVKSDALLRTDSYQEQIPPLSPRQPESQSTPGFSEFRAVWEWSDTESTFAAEQRFHKLAPADKRLAVAMAKPFIERCKADSIRLCHAKTYIEEKRWQRLAEKSKAASGFKSFNRGTANFERWCEYYKATGQWRKLSAAQSYGVHVESDWPPPLPDELTRAVNLALGGPREDLLALVPAESLAMEAWADAVRRIAPDRKIALDHHRDYTKPYPRPTIYGAFMPAEFPPGYGSEWTPPAKAQHSDDPLSDESTATIKKTG